MATVFKMPSAPTPPDSPERSAVLERSENEKAKPFVVNKAFRKSKCRGPKKECPGEDNMIAKGELRLGSRAEIDGRDSIFWRHIECVTTKMLQNKDITPDTLDEFIDYCIDDGTKMSITKEEARNVENTLRVQLGGGIKKDEEGGEKKTVTVKRASNAESKAEKVEKKVKKIKLVE